MHWRHHRPPPPWQHWTSEVHEDGPEEEHEESQDHSLRNGIYNEERGKTTYLSHNTEDFNCPTRLKLNTMADEVLPQEVFENEQDQEESKADSTQVEIANISVPNTINTGLNTLKPVPTELLIVTNTAGNPVHIELDSVATVNFILLNEAVTRNFTIYPNSQSSNLVMVPPV